MALLPPLVTVVDLGDWLGESIDGADARAGAVVRAASTRIRKETGRDWITDDTGEDPTLDEATPTIDEDDLEVAQTVVKMVAGRVWRNPAGATQESTGPFSVSWSGDAFALTETEQEMLSGYRTTGRLGLWTLSTTRGCADLDTTYLPVDPPGQPIPYLSTSEPY